MSQDLAQGKRTTGRRSDGERSRAAILDEAARLSTVEGINGLSIARLAATVGMSKSGLFAHFGSKEELQLATVAHADAIFATLVTEPASAEQNPLQRLRKLAEGYLRYVEGDTFPGGCFFASAMVEMTMQPGRVRDQLVTFLTDWLSRLETAARDAQAAGLLQPDEDPAQIAFDIEAALFLANAQYALTRSHQPIERARRTIERRLGTGDADGAGSGPRPPDARPA